MQMSNGNILVIDDDRQVVESIRLHLEHNDYRVSAAYNGQQALAEIRANQPDLIILDLMLPLVNGFEMCRVLRAESEVPIIMLTGRAAEEDKLRGLELGADDYVTKPFSPREVVARVRTILRRRVTEQKEREAANITAGAVTIDFARHEVRHDGMLIALTPTEFKLLAALAKSPHRTFTRAELIARALGWDYEGMERTVDAHIMNLRRKINAAGSGEAPLVVTVFGVGYKFADEKSSL